MGSGSDTPNPPTPHGAAVPAQRHASAAPHGGVVTLVKGRHRWLFAYGPGDEADLLAAVSSLAERPSTQFDWFDAALVSHQVAKRLRPGLKRVDDDTPAEAGPQ